MKATFFVLILLISTLYLNAQYIYRIKADSVRIYNDSCNSELILENSTKNVNGFLYNRGNGRTEFRKAMIKVNDSTYVFGSDTLHLGSFTTGGINDNIQNQFSLKQTARFWIDSARIETKLGIGTVATSGYQLEVKGNSRFVATNNSSLDLTAGSNGAFALRSPSYVQVRPNYGQGNGYFMVEHPIQPEFRLDNEGDLSTDGIIRTARISSFYLGNAASRFAGGQELQIATSGWGNPGIGENVKAGDIKIYSGVNSYNWESPLTMSQYNIHLMSTAQGYIRFKNGMDEAARVYGNGFMIGDTALVNLGNHKFYVNGSTKLNGNVYIPTPNRMILGAAIDNGFAPLQVKPGAGGSAAIFEYGGTNSIVIVRGNITNGGVATVHIEGTNPISGSGVRWYNDQGVVMQAFAGGSSYAFFQDQFVMSNERGNFSVVQKSAGRSIHFNMGGYGEDNTYTKLKIASTGNVLVGSVNDDGVNKLQVSGNIKLTGVINMPVSAAPTSSSDSSGVDGDLRRDASGNLYLKANGQWLKFTGSTF